jgi:hypothetical protein
MSPLAVFCRRGTLMSIASAYPGETLLHQQVERLPGPAVGRRRPAFGADAGCLLQRVDRLPDRGALLVRRLVDEQVVLRVTPATTRSSIAPREKTQGLHDDILLPELESRLRPCLDVTEQCTLSILPIHAIDAAVRLR